MKLLYILVVCLLSSCKTTDESSHEYRSRVDTLVLRDTTILKYFDSRKDSVYINGDTVRFYTTIIRYIDRYHNADNKKVQIDSILVEKPVKKATKNDKKNSNFALYIVIGVLVIVIFRIMRSNLRG